MKFRRTGSSTICAKRRTSAFTLAEVLAALMFMAIVIPVAVHAVKLASQAGEVALRKGDAARVAERVLNETMISTNWNKSMQSGTLQEGFVQYRWEIRNEAWLQDPMRLVSVQVQFSVQGQDYDVHLSTLADSSQ